MQTKQKEIQLEIWKHLWIKFQFPNQRVSVTRKILISATAFKIRYPKNINCTSCYCEDIFRQEILGKVWTYFPWKFVVNLLSALSDILETGKNNIKLHKYVVSLGHQSDIWILPVHLGRVLIVTVFPSGNGPSPRVLLQTCKYESHPSIYRKVSNIAEMSLI